MYKKLLLVVLSVITLQTVKAQTEKGSQNLGFSFGISTQNSKIQTFNSQTNMYSYQSDGKQTSFNIGPSYSYFIADKLDLGAAVNYGYYNQNYVPSFNSQSKQTSKTYGASIFLRKYFLYNNKVGIRTGTYFSYAKTKQTYVYEPSINNTDDEIKEFGAGINLDFVYYPAKNIGLAAGLANLGYYHNKFTGSQLSTSNNFNLSLVNELRLSIYYVFGK